MRDMLWGLVDTLSSAVLGTEQSMLYRVPNLQCDLGPDAGFDFPSRPPPPASSDPCFSVFPEWLSTVSEMLDIDFFVLLASNPSISSKNSFVSSAHRVDRSESGKLCSSGQARATACQTRPAPISCSIVIG